MDGSAKRAVHSRDSPTTTCPHCGKTFPILPTAKRQGYYYRARAWVLAAKCARAKITANQARDFRRIDKLGDTWGLRLDELRATYRMVRWVGAPQFLADREKRYRPLVALLEKHGAADDLGKRFAALAKAMPAVGRWENRTR